MTWKGPVCFIRGPDHIHQKYIEDRVPGVYILACVDESRRYHNSGHTRECTAAMYVGQTGGLISQRIESHMSDEYSNPDLYAFIQETLHAGFQYWFLEEHNRINRANFEHSLFCHYGGTRRLFNISVPPGHRVLIEPPF